MGISIGNKTIGPKLRNWRVVCLCSLTGGLSSLCFSFLSLSYCFHDATVSQNDPTQISFERFFQIIFLTKKQVLGGSSFLMVFTGFSLSFHGLFTHFSRTFHAPKFQRYVIQVCKFEFKFCNGHQNSHHFGNQLVHSVVSQRIIIYNHHSTPLQVQ